MDSKSTKIWKKSNNGSNIPWQGHKKRTIAKKLFQQSQMWNCFSNIMLGISVIRVPGMRCIKQNVKSLLGILFTEAAFLGVAFLIFLLLLISYSFRRLTQDSSYAENGHLLLPNGNRFRPIINHKQLLELQSPGMHTFWY